MTISRDEILAKLSSVIDREAGSDVVSLGMISGVAIKDSKVGFVLTVNMQDKDRKSYLEALCKEAVASIPGVASVTVVLTAESAPKPEAAPKERAQWNLTPLPGVAKVIAVASGKGGVGKSTTAVNLAHALKAAGKKVGLLDADIYGPSLPRMMGISGKPEVKDGMMLPPAPHGIPTMSMGLIAGDGALVWRGPQLSKALHQLLRGTAWGELDILLVDMPPGTGDIHLSMAQQVPLSGAIIVTTPQEIAVIDAHKCADMFRKVNVPILGVIENMSYFTDPSGQQHKLFGEGGGKKLAETFSAPLLGQIPLEPAIREAADHGTAYRDADLYRPLTQKL